MTAPATPAKPPLTAAEPVRVAYVLYTSIQGLTAVLLLADVISATAGGIIVGASAVIYGGVSELFVRPSVTPNQTVAAEVDAALHTEPPPPTPAPSG